MLIITYYWVRRNSFDTVNFGAERGFKRKSLRQLEKRNDIVLRISLKRIWNVEEIQHRQDDDELADQSGSSGLVVRPLHARTLFGVKLTYLMSYLAPATRFAGVWHSEFCFFIFFFPPMPYIPV